MWILQSHEDFLDGKRLWLRPGRKYLFGRVKKDGVSFAIDHKTVSRKHFIIDVAEVTDSEVTQIHARTQITIIDQGSKSGTSVNGFALKGDSLSRDLTNAENTVRPGSLPHELIIKWQPCIVTYHLLKKDLKAGLLKVKQDRLKPLGVKAISDFVPDHTTHVVAAKRNTPKGLQGLICGKHLVSESYLDALEYTATPTNLDLEEDASPLERDFDKSWPAPKDHLPPPGKEPTLRPVETYQPGPDRTNIFKDFTFVFGDQAQHEILLPVITTGHGKALLLKVVSGETTVDEAHTFMSNAAGRKGFGEPADDSDKGGVIMVRWTGQPEHAEWAKNLINLLALKLDQRAIDQSEFLDAILANDASLLRQSVPFESNNEGKVAPPPSFAQSFASIRQGTQPRPNGRTNMGQPNGHENTTHSGPNVSQQQQRTLDIASQKLPPQSRPVQNGQPESTPNDEAQVRARRDRFKMPPPTQKVFDDGFDPDAIVDYEDDDDDDEVAEPSHVEDSEPGAGVKDEPTSTRKRRRDPSPSQQEQSFANDMDELLPAATAMKKRKLELEAEAKRKGLPVPFSSTSAAPAKKPKKQEKEIDVREMARAHREKEAEAARRAREEEDLLPPHDENDREPANLVQIEYMDLPVRASKAAPRTGRNPEDDSRWDPKWNGRKNFKKFRPQEAGAKRLSDHTSKVFVELVSAKKNTGGLGDKYWPKSQEDKDKEKEKRRKEKQRSQRTQSSASQARTQTQTATDTGSTRRVSGILSDDDERDQDRQTSPAATRLQEEAAAIVDHDIDMDSPRRTRGDDARSQTQQQTQTQVQKQGTKRPAPKSAAPAAKKRQKTIPVTTVHGSDSDDGGDSDDMKFKFGSRRRKGKA